MDANNIVTVLVGVSGVLGGFFGGKRLGGNQAVTTAVEVSELLQLAVDELRRKNAEKETELAELRARVDVLESMITQRAEVQAVHEEVLGVRGIVDRIAVKVGL